MIADVPGWGTHERACAPPAGPAQPRQLAEVERHIRRLIPTITVAGALLALIAGVPQAAADAISTSPGTETTSTAQTRPALLCIHTREGSWTNPNYGGMGLMIATQQLIAPDMLRKYGTTAHASSPHDQLVAGYRLCATGGSPGRTRRGCAAWRKRQEATAEGAN